MQRCVAIWPIRSANLFEGMELTYIKLHSGTEFTPTEEFLLIVRYVSGNTKNDKIARKFIYAMKRSSSFGPSKVKTSKRRPRSEQTHYCNVCKLM